MEQKTYQDKNFLLSSELKKITFELALKYLFNVAILLNTDFLLILNSKKKNNVQNEELSYKKRLLQN